MILHRDARIVYLSHPRTASTSTEQALISVGFEFVAHKHAQLIDAPRWMNLPETERAEWEVWTTVRNPYDALVSWWFAVHYNHPRICPEWVHKILEHDPKYMMDGRLWRLHGKDATTVLRFETLPGDLERELDRIGLPIPDLPRRNPTTGRRGRPYQEFYDAETRDYVRWRIPEDFEEFGYEWEERAVLTPA